MCVCIYIGTRVYICTYMHTHTHVHTHIYTYTYICIHSYVYVYVNTCTYIYMYMYWHYQEHDIDIHIDSHRHINTDTDTDTDTATATDTYTDTDSDIDTNAHTQAIRHIVLEIHASTHIHAHTHTYTHRHTQTHTVIPTYNTTRTNLVGASWENSGKMQIDEAMQSHDWAHHICIMNTQNNGSQRIYPLLQKKEIFCNIVSQCVYHNCYIYSLQPTNLPSAADERFFLQYYITRRITEANENTPCSGCKIFSWNYIVTYYNGCTYKVVNESTPSGW